MSSSKIFLETERLFLCDYNQFDIQALYRLKSNPEVLKYNSQRPYKSMDEAKTELNGIINSINAGKDEMKALYLKRTGDYIGEAGVLTFNERCNRAAIGYNLLPQFWNKGYATEISRAVVRYLFEVRKVERIEALVHNGNYASAKVLSKLGFQKEGHLRKFAFYDDKYHDVLYFGLLKDEALSYY